MPTHLPTEGFRFNKPWTWILVLLRGLDKSFGDTSKPNFTRSLLWLIHFIEFGIFSWRLTEMKKRWWRFRCQFYQWNKPILLSVVTFCALLVANSHSRVLPLPKELARMNAWNAAASRSVWNANTVQRTLRGSQNGLLLWMMFCRLKIQKATIDHNAPGFPRRIFAAIGRRWVLLFIAVWAFFRHIASSVRFVVLRVLFYLQEGRRCYISKWNNARSVHNQENPVVDVGITFIDKNSF